MKKRVNGETVKWGEKGRRINSISPGIIVTPLCNNNLTEYGLLNALQKGRERQMKLQMLLELLMSDRGCVL